uniref:Uncharacterized protein n=1 Tax=Anguilla anguilla TaxID=7936 RepID=A0A0E9T3H9_ANGAN
MASFLLAEFLRFESTLSFLGIVVLSVMF